MRHGLFPGTDYRRHRVLIREPRRPCVLCGQRYVAHGIDLRCPDCRARAEVLQDPDRDAYLDLGGED